MFSFSVHLSIDQEFCKDGNLLIPMIKFIPRNAFISSSVVSKLQPLCVAYLFVLVTMISRGSFIPVTVWNMSKSVESNQDRWVPLPLKYNPFCHSPSLSFHFHSFVLLVFFFLVLSSSYETLPFFWFMLFLSDGALTFSFMFCLWSPSFASFSWYFWVERP